jgi:hypothetical protein
MNAKVSPVSTIGSVVVSVAAVLGGRFLGWAFGLSFVLPFIVGLVTVSWLKRRQNPFAVGLGFHAAAFVFSLLTLVVAALRHDFVPGPMSFVLRAVAVAAFVWAVLRPAVPSVGVVVALHGYALVMSLFNLPSLVRVAT